MQTLDKLNSSLVRDVEWDMTVGDTVDVHFRIVEGDKERIQVFRGTLIALRGAGPGRTFVVRRMVAGEGVERTFPYYSPKIAQVETIRRGRVRRAKLYYLRTKVGKATRVREDLAAQQALRAAQKAKRKSMAAEKNTKAESAEA